MSGAIPLQMVTKVQNKTKVIYSNALCNAEDSFTPVQLLYESETWGKCDT